MRRIILHRILFLFVIILMGSSVAYAAQEHFYNSKNGKHFAADSTLSVQDDKYGTSLWSTISKNVKVTDIITLELNEDTALFLIGKHRCRVDLEITYYDSAGHADSLATTLSINYDSTKSKRFNFRSSFKFNGGYKVKARILGVFYDGSLTSHFPKVFTLAGDIYINRIYHFSCSSLPDAPDTAFDHINQRLKLTWLPDTGADEYDLEYTLYDDSSSVVKNNISPHTSSTTYTDFGFLYTN
ncbi:MAG TPA: hypothetical protein VNY36_02175, partial [Bacteroidia bacterium]|nr:hypothetical protein [Bacteroidia bacterium]